MTNIELDFYRSAISYFGRKEDKNIDWEERRFQAAAQCMAQLLTTNTPVGEAAPLAVMAADALIEELKH